MALDPLDPFAPPPLVGEQVDPWGWVPPQWLAPAVPAAPVQPGLGIPQATLDALPQPEIEMPAMDVAPQPAEIQMPAMDVGQPEIEMPALDVRAEQPAALQPGLGIPAATLDALPSEPEAVPAPTQEAQPEAVPLGQPEMPVEYQSPEARAGYRVNLEADRAALARKRQAEALLADERAANEERQVLLEAREAARRDMDQARQEAANLANEQPTSEDWYEQGGLGRTAFALIAAIGGGLVQHLNGGRNVGMEMIDKNIERFIRDRRANIAHRRAMLGDQRQTASAQLAQAVADQREDAAFRLAAFDRTMQAIQLEAQNYDPQGSKALAYADALDDIAARRAQAEAAEAERLAKLNEAQRKAYLEERKFQADERDRLAKNKIAQTSAYASLLTAKSGAKKTDAEIKAMEVENALRTPEYYEASGLPRPPHEMTGKQYREWLAAKEKGAEVRKGEGEAAVTEAKARLEKSGPGGSPYAVAMPDGTPIMTTSKDGKQVPFEIANTDALAKARALVESAANITAFADKLSLLRDKTGGAWNKLNSDEVQELKALATAIDFETFKGFDLGAPSEGDKALAESIRGGDPTSFINAPTAGLESYARSVQQKVNTKLGVLGRKGAPIQFARVARTKTGERTILEDLDVFDAPEIDNPDVDIEIRKSRAQTAVRAADSLARKIEGDEGGLALIDMLLEKNAARVRDGLLDARDGKQAEDALKRRRKQITDSMRPESKVAPRMR